MIVGKLVKIEVKIKGEKIQVFEENIALNFDVQANCFMVSHKNQSEIFIFPVAEILWIKTSYEPTDVKPILIPNTRVNLPSTEMKQ